MAGPRASVKRLVRGVRQRLWRLRLELGRRRTPIDLRSSPTLDLTAAPWAIKLFEPEFRVLRREGPGDPHDAAASDNYLAVRAADLDTPFVQPITMNPSSRPSRHDQALPPGFAELASAARREVSAERPTRRLGPKTDAWLTATAAAQVAYRHAHRNTTTHVVSNVLSSLGRSRIEVDHQVAIVCATNRPDQLENVIGNYERQRYEPCRLVLVTNSAEFDHAAVEHRLETVPKAIVIAVPEHESLGACLNAGMRAVDARFVAKFDDDDRYGPEYLVDMMAAHRFARAGVVGKHSHLAHFPGDGRTYVRFPGREFEYTSWVAGGTLVIDRERVGDLRFRDRSLGEDGAFLADCQRAGNAVYAADRFHYVQHRTGSHTWDLVRGQYLRHAVEIAQRPTEPLVEP